jgi:hypothetical protein
MAEGAMPGAPQISGTNDATHFYHQPPPLAGLNLDIAGDVDTGDSSTNPHQVGMESSPPGPNEREGRSRNRARFPDDADQLERKFSAKPVRHEFRQDGSPVDVREEDREPSRHSGAWQSFRSWVASWGEDLGIPGTHQDVNNLIGWSSFLGKGVSSELLIEKKPFPCLGDTGIDVHTIQRIRNSGGISSLVGRAINTWSTCCTLLQYCPLMEDDRWRRP